MDHRPRGSELCARVNRFPCTALVTKPFPLLLFAMISALPGCRPSPNPGPLNSSQATWEEQIDAVRGGRSSRIWCIRQPIVGERWKELAAAGERLEILTIEKGSVAPHLLAELAPHLTQLRQLKLGIPVGNEHLAAIAQFPSLKVLNLTQGEFDDGGLRKLKLLPRLELLRFHSPNVSDGGLQEIAALPALRFLHLINVPITDDALVHIAGITKLESFYLDGGDCTEAGLSELIKERRDLHFHWNDLHLADDPQAE